MSGQQFPEPTPLPSSPPMPPTLPITFDDIEASARRALERMQSTSESIAGTRAEVSDDDELVTVVVDGNGSMTDLRISPSAMSKKPDELAALIVETAGAAAASAFGQVGGHISAFMQAQSEEPPLIG
ncbi:YbaB/EbfC family nucleoid-associated protein [Williamsia sp. SKLECPSW1]